MQTGGQLTGVVQAELWVAEGLRSGSANADEAGGSGHGYGISSALAATTRGR